MKTDDLDIVYFVKDSFTNEELRLSLRSVDRNMPHKRVWVFGGCPRDIVPDVRVRVEQEGRTKWDKVHNMYKMVAENKEITDNFILFNDDFFVMKPTDRIDTLYRCSLEEYINMIEKKNHGKPNGYTKILRECRKKLTELGKDQLCYELHTPFIFNKEKLLKLLNDYPEQHCTRTLYGNLYNIGGEKHNDVKIFDTKPTFDYKNSCFISTDDSIVNVNNDIWRYFRKELNKRSQYETVV